MRAPRGSYRAWTWVLATAFAATSALYIVGTGLLAGQFEPRPQFVDALADLPTRFGPPGYLGEVETTFTPIRPAATVLYEWTGGVFWAVALAASPASTACATASPTPAASWAGSPPRSPRRPR